MVVQTNAAPQYWAMALLKPTMCTMIQNRLRGPITALISPLAKFLLKIGVTPNAITAFGAIGASVSAIYFFARGDFFIGTVAVTLFVLSDLFDGTMARLSESGSTPWGALIDSTLDRIADAAIFIGVLFFAYDSQETLLSYLTIYCLITGGLIPYIRAKAESLGIPCSVGIAERTERLVLVLIGTGLYGLGVDYALIAILFVIAILSTITVAQRLLIVSRAK